MVHCTAGAVLSHVPVSTARVGRTFGAVAGFMWRQYGCGMSALPINAHVLAWCGVAGLLVGVIPGGTAGLAHVRAVRNLEQVDQQLAAVQKRLQARHETKRMLQEHAPRYRELQRAGFIGSQLPDWVESLEQLRAAVPLPALHYKLSSPQPVEESHAGLRLYAGYLDLELRLHHEGELLVVLDSLPLYFKGLVQPESCNVERVLQHSPVRLSARCRIRWFTLQDETQVGAWQG